MEVAIGLAVLVALVGVGGFLLFNGPPPAQIVGYGYTPYAHEHEPFARELFTEHARYSTVKDPVLGFRFGDYDKRYIHVTDGARRTWQPERPERPERPELTVWFFGGSAMFGVGQRDEHTIPSEVAKLADRDGIPIRAVNYGASGYVRWQEVALYRRLIKTQRPPDLVVFYDGINDFALACRAVKAGVSSEGQTLVGLKEKTGDCPDSTIPAAADGMSDPQLGVPTVAFWQPDVFTQQGSDLGPLYKRLKMDAVGAAEMRRQERAVIAQTRLEDLSGALDGAKEPLLFDYAHTNEQGAKVAAAAMYERLRSTLTQLRQ